MSYPAVIVKSMFDTDRPSSVFASALPPADGTPLPASPALPGPGGRISTAHDADITEDTIIPPWHGRIYEPEDCDERYRRYLERTPRRFAPVLVPIQV
jgi:hypothetical protein